MKMKFRITYTDGRVVETATRPKGIVAFERQYNVSFADLENIGAEGAKNPPLEWLWYLAWTGVHFAGQDTRPFDDFLNDIDGIEGINDEPEPLPLDPAPSGEASRSSPSEPA